MRLLSEPGVTRTPRAPVRPASPSATEGAASTPAACFAVGPFPSAAAAAKAGAQLDRLQVAYAVRPQAERVPSGWQVLLPPPGSKAQAEAKRKQLTRLGIQDHYLILGGRNKGAISLGLFSTPEAAQTQLAHLRRLGVQARIDTRYRRGEQFWLEGTLSAAPPAWTGIEGLQWEPAEARASQRACPAPAPTNAGAPTP